MDKSHYTAEPDMHPARAQIDYSPGHSSRRRRQIAFSCLVLATLLLCYPAYRIAIEGRRHLQAVLSQRRYTALQQRCLAEVQAPDTVVYETDPVAAEPLRRQPNVYRHADGGRGTAYYSEAWS